MFTIRTHQIKVSTISDDCAIECYDSVQDKQTAQSGGSQGCVELRSCSKNEIWKTYIEFFRLDFSNDDLNNFVCLFVCCAQVVPLFFPSFSHFVSVCSQKRRLPLIENILNLYSFIYYRIWQTSFNSLWTKPGGHVKFDLTGCKLNQHETTVLLWIFVIFNFNSLPF